MALRFPESHNDWKFDLVGLLAIIGESIVSEIVQPLTASRTVFLPRLLPAPHALIRPSRRTALPSRPIAGVGVYTGFTITSLPYFPDMIHQLDLAQPYEVQEFFIRLKDNDAQIDSHTKLAKVKPLAPLKLITVCSSLWTAGILVWAILLGDGPAVVAIILVAVASSLHSAASFWRSRVKRGSTVKSQAPPGDLVLSTREGNFIVIHCSESIARLLYEGGGTCDYVMGGTAYQFLIWTGTLLLMVGIVMMSNCGWTMQVILGASYLALNGIYMSCVLTPSVSRSWHWDLPLLDIVLQQAKRPSNYTEALWEAIRATGDTEWVIRGKRCPDTAAWMKWLAEARENLKNPDWDAVLARDRYMEAAALEAQGARQTSEEEGNPSPFQSSRRRTIIL